MTDIKVKISAIIPLASKSKIKAVSVALIPEIIEPPSTRDGMVTKIKIINKIFVDFLMYLFFTNIKNVCMDSIKITIITQTIIGGIYGR